jgi:hypothetical protein
LPQVLSQSSKRNDKKAAVPGTYPHDDLVKTNKEGTRSDFEHELIETGTFDVDSYFDVIKSMPRKERILSFT